MIRQHNGNKQAHLIALERWKALGQDHPKIVALDMDALSQAMGLELETTTAEALEYTQVQCYLSGNSAGFKFRAL